MQAKRLIALVLAVFLMFSVPCHAVTALPTPEPQARNMLLNDATPETLLNATLYYVSSDGMTLTPLYQTVAVGQNESPAEAVLDELFASARVPSVSSVPAGARVASFEQSGELVTVNLSLDTQNVQTEQELFMLFAAVSSTLFDLPGIEAVNILIDNSHVGFSRLPVGVFAEKPATPINAWGQLRAESEWYALQGSVSIQRSFYVYLPQSGSPYFLPETVSAAFSDRDFSETLFDRLFVALRTSGIFPAGTDFADWMRAVPVISVNGLGQRVLTVDLTDGLWSACAEIDLPPWQAIGSLVLTATSFLPDLDAVRLMRNGEDVISLDINGAKLSLTDGMLYRRDFSGYIGSSAALYLAEPETSALTKQTVAVSKYTALSPAAVLRELLNCGAPTFPAGVCADDLLGMSVSENIATVNLSANFYRACQSLDPVQERSLVYAMVNTLCEFENIRGVRLVFEGYATDTLASSLVLNTLLLPNPGLVAEVTE